MAQYPYATQLEVVKNTIERQLHSDTAIKMGFRIVGKTVLLDLSGERGGKVRIRSNSFSFPAKDAARDFLHQVDAIAENYRHLNVKPVMSSVGDALMIVKKTYADRRDARRYVARKISDLQPSTGIVELDHMLGTRLKMKGGEFEISAEYDRRDPKNILLVAKATDPQGNPFTSKRFITSESSGEASTNWLNLHSSMKALKSAPLSLRISHEEDKHARRTIIRGKGILERSEHE
ncbi:MAG: hypothetical protein AABX01_06675 [Candidatus Micrarchaeota archaeon]